MATRPYVDFSHVEPAHADIDLRLVNWARWCIGGGGSGLLPMFHGFQESEHWVAREIVVPIDGIDGQRIEKAIYWLPSLYGVSLRWNYVYAGSPAKMAREIGCSMDGLRQYVRDGRQMLINRGA